MTHEELKENLDRQVAYLTENPENIYLDWKDPSLDRPLFGYVNADLRNSTYKAEGSINFKFCGCVTQIKSGEYQAPYPELEDYVYGLDIPVESADIEVRHLPIFQEAQLYIDQWFRSRGLR